MWLVVALTVVVLWAPGIFCLGNRAPTHTVSTTYATYLGNFTPPYSLAFLGVPYAEPPIGNLRFRKPVPLNTHKFNKTVVLDAVAYPESCVQGTIVGIGGVAGGTEDCLKVNIYTPFNATKSSKLPVLFFIHGGGYVLGNPKVYPFEHWINQSPNVVVVSIYYRLSSFGFLSHPSFSYSSTEDNNAGFLDQVEALKWVKRNIASFGGDPRRITINGQSAGGGSVQMHLVSKESSGLFHGAIAQSVARESMPTPDQQVPLFKSYVENSGCGFRSTLDALKCLRAAPTSVLSSAQDTSSALTTLPYNRFRPVMDGDTFVDYPTNLLRRGEFARVPLIVGSTSNESLPVMPGQTLSGYLKPWYPQIRMNDIDELQKLYSKSSFPSQDALATSAAGEILLRCGREIIGKAGVQHKLKTWTYRYNQPSPGDPPNDTEHSAELWIMSFGAYNIPIPTSLNLKQKAFGQELIAYWISFVRSWDPNVYKLPRSPVWTGFQEGVRALLQQDRVNSTTKSGIVMEGEPDDEVERCEFIAKRSGIFQI